MKRLLIIMVMMMFMLMFIPKPVAATTVEIQVGAGADDGHHEGAAFYTSLGYLDAGFASSLIRDYWARFTGVNVPQGVSITDAYIIVVVQRTLDAGVKTNIYMNDVDDAVNPTGTADLEAKVRTTAFTAWDDQGGGVLDVINSPSITSVVQEIVDRPSWSSGNAMMILHDDDGSSGLQIYRFFSYNNDPTRAITLHIEYVPANAAPTIHQTFTIRVGERNVTYSEYFNATDTDEDQTLIWEVVTNAPFAIVVDGQNRTAWVNATPDEVGGFYINVTVGDEFNGNATDYLNYTLMIVPAPVVGGLSMVWIMIPIALAVVFPMLFVARRD